MKHLIALCFLILCTGTTLAQDVYEAVGVKFSLNDKDRATVDHGLFVPLDNWQIRFEKTKLVFIHNGWARLQMELIKDMGRKDGKAKLLKMKTSWNNNAITVKLDNTSYKMELSFPVYATYYTFYCCAKELAPQWKEELKQSTTK